jgi:hypothetical protein
MFVPIAGIITAPLSGWIITALDWRWLFIIEGLLSLVVLVLWMQTIYDRPQEAKWISEAEKKYLVETLAAEQRAIAGKEVKCVARRGAVEQNHVAADRPELLLSDRNLRLHPVAADHFERTDALHDETGRGARHSAVCRRHRRRDVPVLFAL